MPRKKNTMTILGLPDDVINVMTTYFLIHKEVAALSETCRFFRDSTNNQRQVRKKQQVNTLVEEVVRGEESEALWILKRFPLLLLTSGKAEDYSRRTVQATPFQAALCAGDSDLCRGMMNIAKKHNMENQLRAQLEAVFPDGIEAHVAQQKQTAFNFDAIVRAITKASDAELQAALNRKGTQLTQTDEAREKPDNQLNLTEALNRFREQFAEVSQADIVFNPYHLLLAFERHDQEFGHWSWNQRDLFWQQVVGWVQCFLPACYAQAFTQGIYNVAMGREPLTRSFKFRIDGYPLKPIFPPQFDDYVGLGFDCAIEE